MDHLGCDSPAAGRLMTDELVTAVDAQQRPLLDRAVQNRHRRRSAPRSCGSRCPPRIGSMTSGPRAKIQPRSRCISLRSGEVERRRSNPRARFQPSVKELIRSVIPGMFRETESDGASATGIPLVGKGAWTSVGVAIAPGAWGRDQRPQFPPPNPHPLPSSLLFPLLRKSSVAPADVLFYRMRVGRSLFLFGYAIRTRPSPGADRSRAARLYVWASSPPSYLSALTTNPVESRTRRGRCRFGPPAARSCSGHTAATPGKVPHGVYRHELAQT